MDTYPFGLFREKWSSIVQTESRLLFYEGYRHVYPTHPPCPLLDQLESGPWPSFITGLKRLAKDSGMMADLWASWKLPTKPARATGRWHGWRIWLRRRHHSTFYRLKDESGKPLFPEAAEFHILRVQPPAGMHDSSDLLRKLCDVWLDSGGSGLIAFHSQSGGVMLQGIGTENVQKAFDGLNEMGFDLGGTGAARCEMSCYDAAMGEKSQGLVYPGSRKRRQT